MLYSSVVLGGLHELIPLLSCRTQLITALSLGLVNRIIGPRKCFDRSKLGHGSPPYSSEIGDRIERLSCESLVPEL